MRKIRLGLLFRSSWNALFAFLLLTVFVASSLPFASAEETTDYPATLNCAAPAISAVDRHFDSGRWSHNGELVANDFAIYAAASYDAYEPRNNSRAFRIADNNPDIQNDRSYGTTGWVWIDRKDYRNGLSYDVYQLSTDDKLVTIVAFRGTDGWIGPDLVANFSWFNQWINPWDQYRNARRDFARIIQKASANANGKAVTFVATGHSLGGGLAQHVAYSLPCTVAVVFNSSFVVRKPLRDRQSPTIISIYETEEPFERVQKKIVNSKTNAVYRLDLVLDSGTIYNHSMERLAAGMARMALDCVYSNPTCEIEDDAYLARVLYCDRYIGYRGRRDEVFRLKNLEDVCG